MFEESDFLNRNKSLAALATAQATARHLFGLAARPRLIGQIDDDCETFIPSYDAILLGLYQIKS